MTEDRREHDARMNRLASRIAVLLDGENLFDVALVCSLVATFAVNEGFACEDSKQEALDRVIEFMREQFVKMSDHPLN